MSVSLGAASETDDLAARIAALPERVSADAPLLRRGRFLDTSVQLLVGDESFVVTIVDGRVAGTQRGGFAAGDFALIAEPAVWGRLLARTPPPGDHDFLAFYKRKELRIVGDLHPLMAHLLYFKGLLGYLKPSAAA